MDKEQNTFNASGRRKYIGCLTLRQRVNTRHFHCKRVRERVEDYQLKKKSIKRENEGDTTASDVLCGSANRPNHDRIYSVQKALVSLIKCQLNLSSPKCLYRAVQVKTTEYITCLIKFMGLGSVGILQ